MLNLTVGQTYLTRDDQRVKIVMKTGMFDEGYDMLKPFLGDNGVRYSSDGRLERFGFRQELGDLIAEAQEIKTIEDAVNELAITAIGSLAQFIARRI